MTSTTAFPARLVVRLAVVLALTGAAVAGLSAPPDPAPPAKPPDKPARPPEDEEPDAKPVSHHVTSDDPDDAGKTGLAPRAVDLKAAARDAKHFAVKKLFYDLAVRHDVLRYNQFAPKQRNQLVNIAPIPDYIGDKTDAISDPFEVTPLADASWTPGEPVKAARNGIDHVTPYEQLALNAVDALEKEHFEQSADPHLFLSRYNQDVAEAQALTTVLLRLQSDRKTGARRGDAWQAVEDALQKKLLVVLLEELDDRVREGQWDEAYALTRDLAKTYRAPSEQERIAQPLAELVKQTLTRSVDDAQKAEARRRLHQLEELFPNSSVVAPVSDAVKKQAQDLFEAAQQEKDEKRQGAMLRQAKEIWPGLPGLLAMENKVANKHPTLRVGVRELPSRMSPGLASTDSDLRAVELVFEGLVKLDPDGAGGARWEPALAQGRPTSIPRGRQFDLPTDARWSDGKVLTVNDATYTLKQMRDGRLPRRPPVWGLLLDKLDTIEATSNSHRVPLTLQQGWLDPLALMNFKLLPTGADPSSPDFAADPRGSGPYVYAKLTRTDEGGRACVAFSANPYYGARAGKDKLPRIENIHFIAYNFKDDKDPKNDHRAELAALLKDVPGRLDLLLDLTAREAAALQQSSDLNIKKVTGRAPPNRRIYFLAVNNEKLHLDKAAFRCALAYAINREQLLDDDFRASPGQDLHAPLNGPYPVKSWAANPKLVKKRGDKPTFDPFDADLARTRLHESGVQDATISLIYPSGDPLAAKAMTDLAAQVKTALGVTLEPKAMSPNDLRDAVERDHSYSLAYYHYDFPDDVYWLGPLLDYAGDPKENILGYKGELIPMIKDLSRRRNFAEVREWAYQLHDRFLNEEMPFIPLWQLDPLAAVHADLDTGASDPPFDPLLVFPDVDRWTLKRPEGRAP